MKTFEQYLRDEVWQPKGVLDDDMPDAFDTWLADIDTEELIGFADEYVSVRLEEVISKIEQYAEMRANSEARGACWDIIEILKK